MKNLIVLCSVIFASTAMAYEKNYFFCIGQSPDIQTLMVKQVITREGSRISSTFKVDISNESGLSTTYDQDGDVAIGSDDSFEGSFKFADQVIQLSLKAPTYPYYEPRESTVTRGDVIAHLSCGVPR